MPQKQIKKSENGFKKMRAAQGAAQRVTTMALQFALSSYCPPFEDVVDDPRCFAAAAAREATELGGISLRQIDKLWGGF